MKFLRKAAIPWLFVFGAGVQASYAQSGLEKNKCTLSNGEVVYVARTCPVPGTVGEDIARKEHEFSKRKQEQEVAEQRKKQGQEDAYRQRITEEMERLKLCGGKPIAESPEVGMTESQFLNCTAVGIQRRWTVNETETIRGMSRQYVMERMPDIGGIRYLYTRGGIVTGIQR